MNQTMLSVKDSEDGPSFRMVTELPKRSSSTFENRNANLGDYRVTENGDLQCVDAPDLSAELRKVMPFTNKRLDEQG